MKCKSQPDTEMVTEHCKALDFNRRENAKQRLEEGQIRGKYHMQYQKVTHLFYEKQGSTGVNTSVHVGELYCLLLHSLNSGPRIVAPPKNRDCH